MPSTHAKDDRLESMLCRFQDLVHQRSRDDLAQCLRILGMYLALYKSRFGDIPPGDYEHLHGADVVDGELARIVSRGLEEAYAMLRIVGADAGHTAPSERRDGELLN